MIYDLDYLLQNSDEPINSDIVYAIIEELDTMSVSLHTIRDVVEYSDTREALETYSKTLKTISNVLLNLPNILEDKNND